MHPAGRSVSPSQPGAGLEDLGRQLQRLAAALGSPDPSLHLEGVLRVAQEAMSADGAAVVTFLKGRPPKQEAATGSAVHVVHRLQHDSATGPCLEASTRGTVVLAKDLGSEQRWPALCAAITRATGVRSVLSVPLLAVGRRPPVLTLVCSRAGGLTEREAALAPVFGPLVALAMRVHVEARNGQDLERALTSSRTIGVAIGIVMARELLTEEEAFQRLVKASQHGNVKLRDLADEVQRTGTLPAGR